MERRQSVSKEIAKDLVDLPIFFFDTGKIVGTVGVLFATHPIESFKWFYLMKNHLMETRIAKKITPIKVYSRMFSRAAK